MYEVLLIEDSPEYVVMVNRYLGSHYRVLAVETLAAARAVLATRSFDVILIDITLPDGIGFDFVSDFRSQPQRPPLIIMSGRTEVQDRVMGWTLGADDYITKPFSPLEFQIRVQNRIEKHRQATSQSGRLDWGGLSIDMGFHEVRIDENGVERKVELTPIEFKLLICLVKNAERVLSRAQLIEGVWGSTVFITERTVDKHISLLRQKLQSERAQIKTVSGLGYRLVPGAPAVARPA